MPSTRTGASRRDAIPAALLRRLERGEEPTRTLAEMLAVDFAKLLAAVVPTAEVGKLRAAAAEGVVLRMTLAGEALRSCGARAIARASRHGSDLARAWACIALVADPRRTLAQRLRLARAFADDAHSGVREWAWMAARPAIAAEPERAIALLAPWARASSPNLRRFASEATRPRGVWCAHIARLRARPQLGLPILEPLKADPAKYVQDSVGNWLNDAAKDHPDWVRALMARWTRGEPAPATLRIARRACRSLR
jgi:3-methyladenine DNA glycosylase AlkC